MKKKLTAVVLSAISLVSILAGCVQNVTVKTREAEQIADNDALITGYIGGYEEMPSSVGIYFGESEKSMKKIITDSTPNNKIKSEDIYVKYDINVDGEIMLKPNTTYYYQIYARFGEKEILGDVKSFTTLSETIKANVTVLSGDVTDITSSSATILGKLSDFFEKPTETGLYIGLSENEMKKVVRESNPYANYDLDVLDVWFNTGSDAQMSLIPETTYYYQVYAKIGDAETRGEIKTFTTPSESENAKMAE